eukprot:7623088-Lingulodinium_polyedra.AAC.1
MLTMRQRFASRPCLFYWTADSSPQKRFDWLNSGCFYITTDGPELCFAATQQLTKGGPTDDATVGNLTRR